MCAFWRPPRGPTTAKHVFLNRFGNDAFQKGSGPEPFLNRSVLVRTDVHFLVANPGPNQSETALFGIASATMLSKRVPDRSPFWTDRFCSKRMCAFWRPARGPTNPKQLFLNRFGNDAFQTGSGPEPFLHRSVLFKTDVCSFVTSPRPNQSETALFESLRQR